MKILKVYRGPALEPDQEKPGVATVDRNPGVTPLKLCRYCWNAGLGLLPRSHSLSNIVDWAFGVEGLVQHATIARYAKNEKYIGPTK